MLTHKFGIRVPKTVRKALKIDCQEKNNLWQEAIMKEIRNVRVSFKFFEGERKIFQKDVHMLIVT